MTPAEILAAIKTVDGPASGIDADLLDGLHAAAFEPVLPGGGTTSTFLRGDKTWAVPPGLGGVTDGDKGDIVVSGSGATWMFDPAVVTAAAKTLLDDATVANMKTTLGLGSVDNTADTAKPVSTAQQAALDLKAPLASPVFTGQVQAPAGAVGAPGLSFSSATDMGIYASSAMNFSVGGANRMTMATTGVSFPSASFKLTTAASTATRAGFNLPHGAAPTTPGNGDMWTTTAGLFVYINGVIKTVTLT